MTVCPRPGPVNLWLMLFFVLGSLCSAELQWTPLATTGAPSPRRDQLVAFDQTHQRVVVFGGRDDNGVLNDAHVLDLTSNIWTMVPTPAAGLGPEPRFSLAGGVDVAKSRFVIAVGEGAEHTFPTDVWSLDLNSLTWSKLSPMGDAPDGRYGQAHGIHPSSSKLYVSHGFASKRYSDTYVLDLSTDQGVWTRVFAGTNSYNPQLPHGRCLVASTMASATDLLMFGGCLAGGGAGGPCPADDFWKGNDGSWSQQATCAAPRTYGAMAMAPEGDTIAVLYGGFEDTNQILSVQTSKQQQVDTFNVADNKWTRVETTATVAGEFPARRASHAMATITRADGSRAIFMAGGKTIDEGVTVGDIWLLHGTVEGSSTRGGCSTGFTVFALHGLFMVVGWGVCLQAGGFIARYGKKYFADGKWFKLHRALQVAGLILSFIGFIIAVNQNAKNPFQLAHGRIGLVIMLFGFMQPIGAIFRPHPGTPKRWLFNWAHWGCGRIALALALINIFLGLFLIVAPVAVWAIWCVIFCGWVGAYFVFEIHMRSDRKRQSNPTLNLSAGKDKADDGSTEMAPVQSTGAGAGADAGAGVDADASESTTGHI